MRSPDFGKTRHADKQAEASRLYKTDNAAQLPSDAPSSSRCLMVWQKLNSQTQRRTFFPFLLAHHSRTSAEIQKRVNEFKRFRSLLLFSTTESRLKRGRNFPIRPILKTELMKQKNKKYIHIKYT
ncbi:hypothetical protein Tsp_11618 [Trichinella spiralis]|uniref:hypothetical protein n=1 Tax=Trichinella spiralis TaxID=6334 RepID=UPI0001EFE8DD|nr:hypothetical protein Tsp_11618 [Trichinella spiralis]